MYITVKQAALCVVDVSHVILHSLWSSMVSREREREGSSSSFSFVEIISFEV